MPLFFRLAWRNITRNRRRTVITLAAISCGLAAVVVFFGLSNGFHAQWISNSVRVYSGHVVVFADDYRAERNLNRTIDDVPALRERLAQVSGIEASAARIHLNGLISTPRSSTVALIRGIEPAPEAAITGLRQRIVAGEYFAAASGSPGAGRQVLLGYKLAERLNAEIGEKIVLMVQAADGSIGAELFRLQGTFRLGAIDLDRGLAVVNLTDAQQLAVLGSGVTEVSLIVDDPLDVVNVAMQLRGMLDGVGYDVLTWDELLPQAKEMISLSTVFTYVLLVIILLVVALGILNTMLMSIMERTREFGIMRALGTRPRQIVNLVMLEAVYLALLGLLMGVALGAGLNAWLGATGIDLSRWGGAMDLVSSLKPIVYPVTRFSNVLVAALAAFVATLLAAVYPALRAARLRPVDAIRSV